MRVRRFQAGAHSRDTKPLWRSHTMSVRKSRGTTASERLLSELCERTFLGLWSYPNVFRDQGPGTEGKEVCDLLAIHGNHLILFSDKSCAFQSHSPIEVAWKRWHRSAVVASSRQLAGAERWIRQYPSRLFINKKCREPFPVEWDRSQQRFHHIAVALGAKEQCREYLGGSGSLVVTSGFFDPTAAPPFHVDHVEGTRFVHVFDEVTLPLLLTELDTAPEFVKYLCEKEALLSCGKAVAIAGEEHLLGAYLHRGRDHRDFLEFTQSEGADRLIINNYWEQVSASSEYIGKKQVDAASYPWDALIQIMSRHVLAGTLASSSAESIADNESMLRILAGESRFHRRILVESLRSRWQDAPVDRLSFRAMRSPSHENTHYVFAFVPNLPDLEQDYREYRREILMQYCLVFACRRTDNGTVVGIATEPGEVGARTFDLGYVKLDGIVDADLTAEIERIQAAYGFCNDAATTVHHWRAHEFPRRPATLHGSAPPKVSQFYKAGVGRNEPCPCGSGKKFKKCCLRS